MKKILFAALVACFSMNASAQIAVEVMADPFNGFDFKGAKVRYFLDESSAVRATINFGTSSTTESPFAAGMPGAPVSIYSNFPTGLIIPDATNGLNQALYDYRKDAFKKESQTTIGLRLGYEKFIASAGKANFYAGGELGFEKVWNKFYQENEDAAPTGAQTAATNGLAKQDYSWGSFAFNAGVFGGVDYDINSNLYIGCEFGLNFNLLTSANGNGEVTAWDGTKMATTSGELEVKNKDMGLNLTMLPALRIGWKF